MQSATANASILNAGVNLATMSRRHVKKRVTPLPQIRYMRDSGANPGNIKVFSLSFSCSSPKEAIRRATRWSVVEAPTLSG